MKGLLWVLGLSILAVLLALVLQDFHGNVVVLVPPYRIDMGLAAFALALLLFFAALVGFIKLLASLISLPTLAAQYRVKRAEGNARNALAQSVIELAAGRFTRARALALNASQAEELAPAARLLAAQASHRLHMPVERDAFLAQSQADTRTKDASLLIAAQAALDDREPLKARSALGQLSSGPARRVQALRLKLDAARGAGDHAEVMRIVQLLHKHNDLTLNAARALTEKAALERLHLARHDLDKLRSAWREMEAAITRSPALLSESKPRLVASAAQHFTALGARPRALELLNSALNEATEPMSHEGSDARDALFAAFAMQCQAPAQEVADASARIALDAQTLGRLERWCAQYPRSAAAALAAGSACASQELWGKARLHLKDAVRLDSQQSAHEKQLGTHAQRAALLLAQIEERLGHQEEAHAWYREAGLSIRA